MSEITRAYAVYKGQQYNASYNSGTQLWKVDIPSGAESSYGQNNHTYPIELHAFDAAGNETIMHATDGTYPCFGKDETRRKDHLPNPGQCPWISSAGHQT